VGALRLHDAAAIERRKPLTHRPNPEESTAGLFDAAMFPDMTVELLAGLLQREPRFVSSLVKTLELFLRRHANPALQQGAGRVEPSTGSLVLPLKCDAFPTMRTYLSDSRFAHENVIYSAAGVIPVSCRVNRKVAPSPVRDSTLIRPPYLLTIRAHVAKPSPVPGILLSCRRLNGWKIRL
jgi:hypothetical protein